MSDEPNPATVKARELLLQHCSDVLNFGGGIDDPDGYYEGVYVEITEAAELVAAAEREGAEARATLERERAWWRAMDIPWSHCGCSEIEWCERGHGTGRGPIYARPDHPRFAALSPSPDTETPT